MRISGNFVQNLHCGPAVNEHTPHYDTYFQEYPASEGKELSFSNPESYSHAEKKLQQMKSENPNTRCKLVSSKMCIFCAQSNPTNKICQRH